MDVFLIFLVLVVLYLILKKKDKQAEASGDKWSRKLSTSSRQPSDQIQGRSSFDSDDGLATFTISTGLQEEKSNNHKAGKWIQPGESVMIKGTAIEGGLFYLGGKLSSVDGYGTDAALIDDYLKVHDNPMTYSDDSLGYWPKYSTISSKCRGAFLSWLASDRNNPDVPLGYVFIYFYGLERRVLIDAQKGLVDDAELVSIFEEIKRLQTIYNESNSFLSYSTRLMETMYILKPSIIDLNLRDIGRRYDSLMFKYSLAKAVSAGEPINADLALKWLQSAQVVRFTTPATRCKKEFNELFKAKYHQKFGAGMTVKPNKTKLKLHYNPASSTLRGVSLSQEDLPDPSALKAPLKKLIPIANDCMDSLDAYSRYLGKKDNSRNDLEAILLLPDELSDESTSSELAQFKRWANLVIVENDGIASVEDFWRHMGKNLPEKINKKEALLMSNIAQKAGLGVAPDISIHHAKPAPDGKVILFSPGHERDFSPSKAFNDLGMTLRLGSMVASSDGQVDQAEQNLLERMIDDDSRLGVTEKRSLHSYLKWHLNSPSDAAGLKARIEKLGNREKELISQLLISVALVDGKIDNSEIKQLEKLYKSLGLDRNQVTTDLHGQSSSQSVQRTNTASSKNTADEGSGFKLNEELISLHESQTKDVQSMLHSIFSEEDEPETASLETELADEQDETDGLDEAHQSLLDALLKEQEWPRQAVEDMCSQYGLMIDGAIEQINDWSFEVFDAPILEDEGDIIVDQELVKELQK